jgi:hypothetical protein
MSCHLGVQKVLSLMDCIFFNLTFSTNRYNHDDDHTQGWMNHFTDWGVQVGRIPGDWARSLIPLIHTGKVRVEGKCRTTPASLALMDSIIVDFK